MPQSRCEYYVGGRIVTGDDLEFDVLHEGQVVARCDTRDALVAWYEQTYREVRAAQPHGQDWRFIGIGSTGLSVADRLHPNTPARYWRTRERVKAAAQVT